MRLRGNNQQWYSRALFLGCATVPLTECHLIWVAWLRVEVDVLAYDENGDILQDMVADDRVGLIERLEPRWWTRRLILRS